MKPTRRILLVAILALPVLFSVSFVQGAFLLPFTGNTLPSIASVDGHVNFSVLDKTGGSLGDTWGTGLAGFDSMFSAGSGLGAGPLDTAATYLYLFQAVNDGANTIAISQNTVAVGNNQWTSHGLFPGVGFTQALVPVGPGVSLGVSAVAGNISPASTVGSIPGVALVGGLVTPPNQSQAEGGGSQVATFAFPNLANGGTSSVWGYTSYILPSWATTSIQDGGTNATGTVPSPIPEPITIIIWSLLGLAGTGLAVVRRRRGLIGGSGNSPWSEETRTAIRQIVEHGRAK